MAEEEVAAAAAATSPSPADLKRKHPESEVAEHQTLQKEEEETVDAKRPRFDEDEEEEDNPHSLVSENGSQEDKITEPVKEVEEPSEENNTKTETPQQTTDEAPEAIQKTTEEDPEGVENEKPSTDDQQVGDIQPPVGENPQSENENQQPSESEVMEPSAEATRQVDGSFVGDPPASETEGMSRKMDVPNDKVGVLIGKGGETIRYLQINSGAKIQIMRDADVDPQSTNRPVELIGGLENINKAEKLIKDVIAEADAGGSPALVARGFTTAQAAGAVEQVLIQVPNEKVGVIIGKGGDTIKNLQTRSGARIQLIPQHLPDGDQSKERTVRVSGDKKQIERAREMIKEVMNQPPRQSSSGGYNQQQPFRPRGPSSQQQWGSRGPNPSHPSGYNYPQRGPYPSQNSQYQPHGYSNYPPQSGPRGNYGPSWGDQRPPTMQGPPHQGGGYDYYNAPSSGPHSNPHHAHGPGPNHSNMGPPSQGNYNYNQPGSYPPNQGYGHGYAENKYENQAPGHHQQQPYGKAPPYGAPPQNYGQPRASQPSDMPPPQQPYVQNTVPPQQPYGQNTVPPQQPYGQNTVPPQQPYPQNYPSYGPAEGYNQAQPVPGSAPMYPQQSGQVAGYGSYPAQQQGGYAGDQSSAQNNAAGYGYQPGADPAYGGGGAAYGGPPAGQAGYAQPVPAQQGYDQSVPNPGGYGAVPAGYGKGVSPQPGYDATQMYGAAPAPAPR